MKRTNSFQPWCSRHLTFKEIKSSRRLSLGSKIAWRRFSSFVQADGAMNYATQVEFWRGFYVAVVATKKNRNDMKKRHPSVFSWKKKTWVSLASKCYSRQCWVACQHKPLIKPLHGCNLVDLGMRVCDADDWLLCKLSFRRVAVIVWWSAYCTKYWFNQFFGGTSQLFWVLADYVGITELHLLQPSYLHTHQPPTSQRNTKKEVVGEPNLDDKSMY